MVPAHVVDQAATHPAGNEIDQRASAEPGCGAAADDVGLELQVTSKSDVFDGSRRGAAAMRRAITLKRGAGCGPSKDP